MNETSLFDRRISDWLRADAPARARPELLAMTLHEASGVAQERSIIVRLPWLARRQVTDAPLRNRLELAGGLAVAAVVAVVFIGLLRPAPTVGPNATRTPTPPPSAAPERALPVENGPLDAGRYRFEPIFDVPVGIHLAVPAGWQQVGWAIQKAGLEAYVSFWTVETTYSDPCAWATNALNPPLGLTVDDLVVALRGQVGRSVSEPVPVRIGGHAGQVLTLEVPADIGTRTCDGNEYRNWVAPGSGEGSRWVPVQAEYAGYTDTAWILDVSGVRMVVDVTEAPNLGAAVRDEVRTVVESITFDDISLGARFGPCTLDVTTSNDPRTPAPSSGSSGSRRPSVVLSAVGDGWGPDGPGRPIASLLDPTGALVHPGVGLGGGRLDTSWSLDIAGRWRLRVVAWSVGCIVDLPIEVLPVDTG